MAKPYSSLELEDFDFFDHLERFPKEEEIERLLAAEEVCWGLSLAMSAGCFEAIPVEDRPAIHKILGIDKWMDLAVETGIMPRESEAEEIYEAGPVPGYML